MEWRAMAKKNRQLSPLETEDFLRQNNFGHLGTVNIDGSPYVVPLNYAYIDGKFIIHCAQKGQKLKNLSNNPNMCFEVTKHYETEKSDKSCSSWNVRYKSVIAFGKAIFPKEEEKRKLLEEFTRYYTSKEITLSDEGVKRTCVFILDIEHMTGKRSE